LPEKSLPTLASELWELVRDYAKQEVKDPLKGVLRFLGFGLAGALLLGTGLLLLAVGLLRALQTQTGEHLHGNWSWVPYVVVLDVCVATDGHVSDAELRSSASPKLDPIVLRAVKRWRYGPRLVGGKASPFCHRVVIKYERW